MLAAGFSHWLPWFSPSSHWQMLFPSLNVTQMALSPFWSPCEFSERPNFSRRVICWPIPLRAHCTRVVNIQTVILVDNYYLQIILVVSDVSFALFFIYLTKWDKRAVRKCYYFAFAAINHHWQTVCGSSHRTRDLVPWTHTSGIKPYMFGSEVHRLAPVHPSAVTCYSPLLAAP